jgi:hypothetical protein
VESGRLLLLGRRRLLLLGRRRLLLLGRRRLLHLGQRRLLLLDRRLQPGALSGGFEWRRRLWPAAARVSSVTRSG